MYRARVVEEVPAPETQEFQDYSKFSYVKKLVKTAVNWLLSKNKLTQ